MARYKKYSKKNNKCIEPFNSLIDFAAGAAMYAVAEKMEEKHHYRERKVPNPYKASAYGLASGRMNSTEDIVRLGGVLGAMGSFSDDCEKNGNHHYHQNDSVEYTQLDENYFPVNDNKYAWRLNCEDGSCYDIYPEDYETREEYNEALLDAKILSDDEDFKIDDEDEPIYEYTFQFGEQKQQEEQLAFCRVSILKSGKNKYFLCDISNIAIGNTVVVLENGLEEKGIVLSIEQCLKNNAPRNYDETQRILRIDK